MLFFSVALRLLVYNMHFTIESLIKITYINIVGRDNSKQRSKVTEIRVIYDEFISVAYLTGSRCDS